MEKHLCLALLLSLTGCTTPVASGTDAPASDVPGADAPDAPGPDVPGLDAPTPDVPGLDAPSDPDAGRDVIGCGASSTYTDSGPITVLDGMEVTGLRISNPSGPCIVGSHVSGVHIHDNQIGPCGPTADGVGIAIEDGSDVLVDHNCFDDVAGALYVDGSAAPVNDVVFHHNRATGIRGPMPRGQLVQFNTVRGDRHVVRCNESDVDLGAGAIEDHISMYRSSGSAASPILIEHNRIRGGGPSASGGGILAGDGGGSWITIQNNVLVEPGQYGVAIAGGSHMALLNNVVFSDSHPWTNIGLYVWNQDATTCSDIEVRGNRVQFFNAMGESNPAWDAGNCGAVAGWSSNAFPDIGVDASIWDTPMPECE